MTSPNTLCYFLLLLSIWEPTLFAQEQVRRVSSTHGREFFFGFMSNFGGTGFTSLRIQIGTTFEQADYVVRSRNALIQNGTLSRDSPVAININTGFQITTSEYIEREKGLHVFTTNNATIFIIAESFVDPFNHGVFVPYPCLTFETETGYEYFVISTEGTGSTHSQVLLVGCEDDTDFLVMPTQSIDLPQNLQTFNTTTVSLEAGGVYNETINQMQTLLIKSLIDLTGTRIISNKPLTVIAGHECANVPSHLTGCEPLAFQVPPSLTWGNTFLLSAFSGRQADSIIKFVATEETSVAVVCGLGQADTRNYFSITSLQVVLPTGESCFVVSTNPILLVQFATSGINDRMGDPAVTLVSPVDQYVNSISFLAPPNNTFTEVYISVSVLAEHFNPTSILFDQEALVCEWNEIYNTSVNDSIAGYGCNSSINNKLSDTTTQHLISHSDPEGLFSVIVYGFSSSSVGFAYLAGQEITAGFTGGTIIIVDPEPSGIPYYDITDFPGVSELERRVDSVSDPIIIPNGLLFGESLVTTAFVNENGVISFDEPWGFPYPDRFPTSYYWTQLGNAIAPFWSDNDIRREGTVRYTTYCNITDHPQCSRHNESQAILDEVNRFIQSNQADSTRKPFVGNWMLIAQWDHVHPSPHGAENTEGIPPEELSMTNTYQAIVSSNMFRTAMVFTYICGAVQWSAVGSSTDIAVVGYNAAGAQYFNHHLSGYSSVGDSLSCAVRLGKRRKRQSGGGGTISMEVQNVLGRCLDMLRIDSVKYTVDRIESFVTMINEPCPCSRSQAIADTGRFRKQTDNCFVSMKPVSLTDPLTSVSVFIASQCCYAGNALVTSPSINAGSLLLQHPFREGDRYTLDEGVNFGDRIFKETCCDQDLADANTGENYCAMYFERRPISTCDGYSQPVVGIGSGDPHYTTFDGVYYDFQGIGDFTLFETSPPSVTIQGRLDRIIFDRVATWHTLLAFGESDVAFEVGKQPGFQITRTKPNVVADFALFPNQVWVDDPHLRQVELKYREDRSTPSRLYHLDADFFRSGISVMINVNIFNGRHFLDFEVRVPRSYSGSTLGLLGNLDQDRNIEFFRRGEIDHIVYTGIRPDTEVFTPLLTWRTPVADSLFVTPLRKKRQASEPSFTPIFFEELNFTDDQRLFCEDSPPCLYDLVVTESTGVAQGTLDNEKEVNATIEILNNFPPIISANATLRVNLGQEAMLLLSVIDSNDSFTLALRDDLPGNVVLERLSEGEYGFRWTLEQITNQLLVFVANDSRGASSLFTPTVEICACVNRGICSLDGLITSNITIIMNCLCTEAFAGRFCKEDRNGCSEIECFEGVECMDVPAPGVGAVCGSCPPGYTGDSLKCYDINECHVNESLCEQICINTNGGYFCSCWDGYNLIEGTNQCEDINDCEGINDCQQLCQNTIGSYSCNCSDGFILAQDGRNCTAKVPCTGVCSFGCAVIKDEEQCFCPTGFELDGSNRTQCIDRDECTLSNPCEQICNNSEGSFFCSCEIGFILSANDRNCTDIDDCFEAALESSNLCESDPNSQCVNRAGSFECVCVPGYSLNANNTCQRMTIEPPPKVMVILPTQSVNNSVTFISSTHRLNTFTPDRQQKFREVTATAVNNFCMLVTCTLILPSGETDMVKVLMIEATHVALPVSLIPEEERERLIITTYIQIGNNFLYKEHLELAVMHAEAMYRAAGFLSLVTATTPTVPVTVPVNTSDMITVIAISVGAAVSVFIVTSFILLSACVCKCYYNHKHKKKSKKVNHNLKDAELFVNTNITESDEHVYEEPVN